MTTWEMLLSKETKPSQQVTLTPRGSFRREHSALQETLLLLPPWQQMVPSQPQMTTLPAQPVQELTVMIQSARGLRNFGIRNRASGPKMLFPTC